MKVVFKAFVVVSLAAGVLSASGVAAQITTEDRQTTECLDRIHKRMRKLTLVQLDEHSRCHRARMQGKIPPGTDCNDPASVLDPERINHWAGKILQSRVCAYSRPPSDQNHTTCPAPCEAIPVDLADHSGVASCMSCLTKIEVAASATTVFGSPTLPVSGETIACHRKVAQAFSRYLLGRMEQQKKCKLLQDYLRVDPGVDCSTADLKGRIAVALARLQDILTKCTDADLAALDSCGATVATEQICLYATADLLSDTLFDYIRP